MTRTSNAADIAGFLSATARGRAALVIEGESGMGRTTAWLAALDDARRAGIRVLAARASKAERGFQWGVAADLISDVEPQIIDCLPEMQRVAVATALLQEAGQHPTEDQRVLHAAFTSIVDRLSELSPVIVAVDDAQWLDAASRRLLAFAARRLKGRVGMLLTEQGSGDGVSSWLKIETPDGLTRMRVEPMSSSSLHALIVNRYKRSFSRSAMARIAKVSGGNPRYAIELAREIDDPASAPPSVLPPALVEITHRRIGHYDDDVQQALLAAACVLEPTVDEMAVAMSTSVDHLVHLLEGPEAQGIIVIEGNRVRFTETFLAHGVYGHARPARRRRMHRALADVATTSEQRARHMALAVVSADPDTLAALDGAAADSSASGTPAAAAELMELAIRLGGGTPSRRLDAARYHFQAGELDRSRALAESAIALMPPGTPPAEARLLIGATLLYRGRFDEAAESFHQVTREADDGRIRTRGHLYASVTHMILGDAVVAQRHCRQAMAGAEESQDAHLISQALATRVAMDCRRGQGVDHPALERATRLEDGDRESPAPFSARAVHALVLAWTGRLGEARQKLSAALDDCAARGSEADVSWLQFHIALVDIDVGRYADSVRNAEEMILRADQTGCDHVRLSAAVPLALSAAHTGREQQARNEIAGAVAGLPPAREGRGLALRLAMALGFLEVSLGRYEEALNALQPLLSRWPQVLSADIAYFAFVPDAVEALVAVHALERAEELTEALERAGARLDHPSMLAAGARCRSMVLAGHGDLTGAECAALRAMEHHEASSAPFERARTQFILGQLQRRLRRRKAAWLTLEEASMAFDDLGAPIWAARVRTELSRMTAVRDHESELTAAELRVAELTATGMTNKDVAAALFISPKTVECNLGRVYRKLGIRTRVELSRRLSQEGPRA